MCVAASNVSDLHKISILVRRRRATEGRNSIINSINAECANVEETRACAFRPFDRNLCCCDDVPRLGDAAIRRSGVASTRWSFCIRVLVAAQMQWLRIRKAISKYPPPSQQSRHSEIFSVYARKSAGKENVKYEMRIAIRDLGYAIAGQRCLYFLFCTPS